MFLIGQSISHQCASSFQCFPVYYTGILVWFHHIETIHLIHCADQLTVFFTVGILAVENQKALTKVENWPGIVQSDLCNTVFIWQFHFTVSALLHFWNIFDSRESYAFFPLVCPDFCMCFVFRSRLQTFQLRNSWSLFINHIWYVFIVIILLQSF